LIALPQSFIWVMGLFFFCGLKNELGVLLLGVLLLLREKLSARVQGHLKGERQGKITVPSPSSASVIEQDLE
jgi:hypothetical protein